MNNTDDSRSDDDDDRAAAESDGALSRRTLIGGLGGLGVAGAVGLAAGLGVVATSPSVALAAVDPPIDGLVYLPIDAFAFDVASTDTPVTLHRIYQDLTGVQPIVPARQVYASLPIPIGSVVKQINISYQGQPIVWLARRALGSGTLDDLTTPTTTAAGGGPKSQTFSVDAPITPGATYAVRVFCSAGDSILGVQVGYVPPAQAFIPFTGADPRAFDSRPANKFAANEERVIDLSSKLIPTARAAVINLTATETGGPGFLAAFRDGIAYPGNSSVNFTEAGISIANGVVCSMTAGKIKVRTGPSGSHVIVDVIGSLL